MVDTVAAPLAAWADFWVIVGSSGAALTGLQFVVMALINDSGAAREDQTLSAFGTPTVVHFCAVLLTAGGLSMPWGALRSAGSFTFWVGVAGLVYAVIVTNRARRQTGYTPVLEDWLFHSVLPLVGYGFITGAGVGLRHGTADWLFAVGGALLLLLFVGIHNAWDTVMYIALQQFRRDQNAAEPTKAAPSAAAAEVC